MVEYDRFRFKLKEKTKYIKKKKKNLVCEKKTDNKKHKKSSIRK